MEVENTQIPDIKIIRPKLFEDNRGLFFESYNKKVFDQKIDNRINFVQDNSSISKINVLRGLHYQLPPFDQSKLISVQKDLAKSKENQITAIAIYNLNMDNLERLTGLKASTNCYTNNALIKKDYIYSICNL